METENITIIVTNHQTRLSVGKCLVLNGANIIAQVNTMRGMVNGIFNYNQRDEKGCIELMKQFHKEKYYKPKLVFDFNFDLIDKPTFDEIKQIVRMLTPYCQIIIILPNLPSTHIEDPGNEHLINLDSDKYVIDYWACVWIFQLSNEKFILSEEQYLKKI